MQITCVVCAIFQSCGCSRFPRRHPDFGSRPIRRPLLAASAIIASLLLGVVLPVAEVQARATSSAHSALSFANVLVSHDTFAAHSEPAIAENPVNPRNLVASSKFFTDPAHYLFKIGTFYSTDAGKSWHDVGLLPGFEQYRLTSDISLAFSPNGSIVYACVLGDDPGSGRSGIFVSRSRDGGKSWSQPVTVFLDSSGATFSDKPWIAVDASQSSTRGTVYVAWNLDNTNSQDQGRERPPGVIAHQMSVGAVPGIVVSRSTDYGHTFSAPVTLSAFDSLHSAIGAIPAVDHSGRLAVAYLSFDQVAGHGMAQMKISTSVDRGVTFTTPHVATSNLVGLPDHLPNGTFRNLSLPTFVVAPSDGTMTLAWADLRNGDADILAVHSTDHGKTWSPPVRVNHDPLHNGKDQFQPELAVAPNGIVTCSWFDRRYDPHNRLIDVVVAQSRDGGSTFGANLRVTRTSWDPTIDAPNPEGNPNSTFIGDYQALAVDNGAVHPLWNDTQNGTSQEIRTAVLSEQVFIRR